MKSAIASDIEQGRFKHLHFKVKLRSYLYGAGSSKEQLLDSGACPLGHWLNDMAARYGSVPELMELNYIHEEIHMVARKLIRLHDLGDSQAARGGFSEVEEIAKKLENGLIELHEALIRHH